MKLDYGIELVRSSAKTQDLSYTEGSRRLVIELELAGFGKADWVALESDLDSWTAPQGQTVTPEEKQRIRERINDWCRRQRIRVEFVKGIELRDFFEAEEKNGWILSRLPDGSISAEPPETSVPERFRRLWRALFRSGGPT